MPKDHEIKITSSDITTGKLTLDPPILTADAGDTVHWTIMPHSGVDAIEVIQGKFGNKDVWSTHPQNSNNWKGTIKKLDDFTRYEYEITWRRGSVSKKDDPIIAINPSIVLKHHFKIGSLIAKLMAFFLGFFMGIAYMLSLRKKK